MEMEPPAENTHLIEAFRLTTAYVFRKTAGSLSRWTDAPDCTLGDITALGSVGIQDSHSRLAVIQAPDGTIRFD